MKEKIAIDVDCTAPVRSWFMFAHFAPPGSSLEPFHPPQLAMVCRKRSAADSIDQQDEGATSAKMLDNVLPPSSQEHQSDAVPYCAIYSSKIELQGANTFSSVNKKDKGTQTTSTMHAHAQADSKRQRCKHEPHQVCPDYPRDNGEFIWRCRICGVEML
jgi:hypothetical protein